MHLKKTLFFATTALMFLSFGCSEDPNSPPAPPPGCDPAVSICEEPPLCSDGSCELSSSSIFVDISSSSDEPGCDPLLTDCQPQSSSSFDIQGTSSSSSLAVEESSSSGEITQSSSSSLSIVSSSSEEAVSSSSIGGPIQTNSCPQSNFVVYGSVPADPYTACFQHTNSKCYVCKIENERDGNTCASSWLWNNVQNVDDNLALGYWYHEVTCPAGVVVSSSSAIITQSSSSGGTNPGTCKANPATKAEIDACIDAKWRDLGYSSRPTKVIALTFDDGPHSGTGTLLTALKNKDVKATFFVISGNIQNNRSQAQAIHNDGHELGNHSNSYNNATTQSVNACSEVIRGITGSNPKVFRAPNLSTVGGLASTGLPDIWGCNTNDYTNGINTLNSVKANGCARDGGFLLMHESNTSNQNTVPRVGEIIDWLRSQGYWMLTVSQVAIYKGVTPVAGRQYNNF